MKWGDVAWWKEVDRSDALNSFISIFVIDVLKLTQEKASSLSASSGYYISVTCKIGVAVAITDHLRNNPAVELMILVAAILKIRGLVKTTKQTSQNY